MTSVNSATRSQPSRTPASRPQPAPARAQPSDAKAMSDAFAAARKTMGLPPESRTKLGKEAKLGAHGERESFTATVDAKARDADLIVRERESQDQHGQGFGAPAQSVPIVPLAMPAMPAPHVDASAFAQMLADLWTRENGKGAREVQVRFGANAWPATGARLVRNAAGALDIALQVGDGGRAYGDRLQGLGAYLEEAGVTLGALAIEDP
ncbi:hypothetical protein G4G27_22225 [Sphingomonas sp. So64.6b]|uniref:hypothetical protein n=1 Tax=Sphingomonas sp. So64.6b TaxID=2997354 RepID=UPI0016000F72|nr:hypothetical protein [Sphingomonas sp. So64.6b]QNA86393.1 hypothetical protein G4G27_22225 [Sphingomonas sp. So64.6b]